MASNTENLNLLMKNPSTDGADTFNVQTMLNENWQKIDENAGTVAQTLANILKPTTPPIIGLPPSTTPDGMFQALGNTGELHVWRKMVVTGTDIPAGYNVTDTTGVISSGVYGYTDLTITYSDAVDVNDTGGVTLREPTTTYTTTATGFVNKTSEEPKFLSGKFFTVNLLNAPIMYQKPTESWNFSFTTSYVSFNSGYVVKGYPLTPAGTTTTYPVSTNPKAYQEGDDAKAAGYVLGDVENTTLVIAYRQNTVCNFSYSDALYVADDGSISLANPTSGTAGGSYNGAPTYLSGKFLKFVSISGNGGTTLKDGVVYYIPSNATIKIGSYAGYVDAEIDRYQPVTGYAAIPAGTTIEYLGKLGDKARVQFGSYVGTGTFGKTNQNTLNLSFTPRFLIVMNGDRPTSSHPYASFALFVYGVANGITVGPSSANYEIPLYATWNKNSISWYNSNSDYGATGQMNNSGTKYRYVAIG